LTFNRSEGGAGGVRGIIENIFGRLAGAMGLEPVSTKALAMLEQQAGRNYCLDRSGDFASVRDVRQLAVLEVQQKTPPPEPDLD